MIAKNKNKQTEYYIWADEPVEPAEISRMPSTGENLSRVGGSPETTPAVVPLPHHRKAANFIVNFTAAAGIGLFFCLLGLTVSGFLIAAFELSDLLPAGSAVLLKSVVFYVFHLVFLIALPAVIAVKEWNNHKNFIQHFWENL